MISAGLVGGSVSFDLNASNFNAGENVIAKGGGILNPYIKYLTNGKQQYILFRLQQSCGRVL